MSEFSPFWTSLRSATFPSRPRIGLTDPTDPRIEKAHHELKKMGSVVPVLIDPSSRPASVSADYLDLLESKKEKLDPHLFKSSLYQGIGLLLQGDIDGLIAGSLQPTADVVKAALHLIGLKKDHRVLSGQFLIESDVRRTADNGPFLFADCAVVPEPSPKMLALIAGAAVESYRFFTSNQPRVGFLSFSTRGSADHALVDRIRESVRQFKDRHPDIPVDGEMQVDALLDSDVAKIKGAADSPVQARANVFIFPTLESGNIGYKLIQRYSHARIAGPILWGLKKPVSDLSRGCTVDEIIDSALCVATIADQNKQWAFDT